jgi:hypothetical protein
MASGGDDPLMNRRTLISLAAALTTAAAAPALACSVALRSPRSTGRENHQVEKLFGAWWNRDRPAFRALFIDRLMADGTPMDPKLAAELEIANPVPVESFRIFDRHFLDERKDKRLTLLVNTAAGVIAACSEADQSRDIAADCNGIPMLHLFLVSMNGLNPRMITHLASTATAEPGKFGIWTAAAS